MTGQYDFMVTPVIHTPKLTEYEKSTGVKERQEILYLINFTFAGYRFEDTQKDLNYVMQMKFDIDNKFRILEHEEA